LTNNGLPTTSANPGLQYLSARWSADGKYIVFHRSVSNLLQLFRVTLAVNADGRYVATDEKQLTYPPGLNGFPSWGMVRVRIPD
jgi:WD40-like Beta Propeller Repeat